MERQKVFLGRKLLSLKCSHNTKQYLPNLKHIFSEIEKDNDKIFMKLKNTLGNQSILEQ